MGNILIDVGGIPYDALKEYFHRNKNVFFLVANKIKKNELKGKGIPSDKVFFNPCGLSFLSSEKAFIDYSEIINLIISDYKVFQLFDRTESVFSTTSTKIIKISKKCESAIAFITSNNLDVIIFNATPHSCDNWILAKVAELLGVSVLYFKKTVLPWRYNLLQGLNSNPSKIHINENIDNTEVELIYDYIDSKKGKIEDALPSYEKERLARNKGKIFSLKDDILRCWKRPDLIINKYLCWKKYRTLSVKPDLNINYIIFFLHYQPERTTLPEGYLFTQQILAISALRRCTPKEIKIYVKEHPSTFTNLCHWKERNIKFYDEITSIPNVELVSMEQDQYVLIDNSKCTSTITGTVLFESVVRGIPAIAFGLAPYVSSDAHYNFKSESSLQDFITSLFENNDVIKQDVSFNIFESLEFSLNINWINYKDFQENTNNNHLAAAKGISMLLGD